jgi:predicted short-subunit dehydrogenase-like oxidoreductase (DUF2520 family)
VRELERSSSPDTNPRRCSVIGRGRVGTLFATRLRDAGWDVDGPLGRGATADDADLVVLAVPDSEIGAAAAALSPAPERLVGHCSGASRLDVLEGHEAFSIHPLMTITGAGADLDNVACAIAGSSPRALASARELADALGMRAFEVADEDRALYHAAASVASNFLITLEAAAEQLASSAGVDRDALVPLVRASVENWSSLGARTALTGPIARGDELTVARQRAAIAEAAPELLDVFDVLAATTRALARGDEEAAA